MNDPKEFTYSTYQGLDLKVSFYKSETPSKNQAILYFHGGGLIYGTRTDLPKEYIQQFLDNGYHFLAFDYLLAPETKLPDIFLYAQKALQWFFENSKQHIGIAKENYILFGRSAGAYLTFLLASPKNKSAEWIPPKKVISFYGYTSLSHKQFREPSLHYQKFPSIPETMIKKMIKSKPIAYAPLNTRYALYVYARQTGHWLDFLGVDDELAETYSLSKEDLLLLPPVFLAQSNADQDVPYSIGEALASAIPNSFFYKVKGKEHDFDRDTESPESLKVYEACITWLE